MKRRTAINAVEMIPVGDKQEYTKQKHVSPALIEHERDQLREINRELVKALKDGFFQFEHNGEESDNDKAVLNMMQKALTKAEWRT